MFLRDEEYRDKSIISCFITVVFCFLRMSCPCEAEHAEADAAGTGNGLGAGQHGGSGGDDVVHQ